MTNYIKCREKIEKNFKENPKLKLKYLDTVERLEKTNSKVILNSYHLSNLCGVKWQYIKAFVKNPEKQYYNFQISKKSGGKRQINMPNEGLSVIQQFIKDEILDNIPIHASAHGFKKNSSIISNASKHLNQEMVLNIDLKDFFPSIGTRKVFYIFNSLCGYDEDLSYCLTRLVTLNDSLAQGACTSPIISNIVSFKMDNRLYKLSEKLGIVYTRYADDITFSGAADKVNNKLLYMVEKIINECGYSLNKKKTRFQFRTTRQEVTGLIVNGNEISIPSNYIRKIRQEIYYIKKYGLVSHKEKLGFYNKYYRDHLYGKIMFVRQINRVKGDKLLQEYNTISWFKYN